MERIAYRVWGIPALLFVLICGMCLPASAKVVYVNKNATGAVHDGKTWGTAYMSVQSAIDASKSGDEVWVASGTYTENIAVAASISLYGGFAGTETDRSQREWKSNATTLQGGPGVVQNSVVDFSAAGIVLDGFVIRNGNVGVRIRNGTATLTKNIIFGNRSHGVSVDEGTATLSDNDISGNSNCGVFEYYDATLALVNNTVAGNGNAGVAVDGTATFKNNTISGNATGVDVLGVAKLTNNIVAFNRKYGVKKSGGTIPTLGRNDVCGNGLSGYYGILAGPTDISLDPLLTNAYRDIHLLPASPCIDAGDDTILTPGQVDVYGKPRVWGSHVDIGSDEFDGTVWAVPHPRVWYVASTGKDSNDGSDWSKAKRTVAAGLWLAQRSDEVWVAQGTYVENGLSLTPGVALFGGFAGTETKRSQRNWRTNVTVLDGGGIGNNVVECYFSGVVVDGFSIRSGKYGVLLAQSSSATIADNSITGNTSEGVAIDSNDAANVVVSNIISGNAKHGVYLSGGTVALTNNVITASAAGGVYVGSASTATLVNNTISGNGGDGVYVDGGSDEAKLTNNIVAFNSGCGVHNFGGSVSALSHNNVFANALGGYRGITPGSTDTAQDPLFVDRKSGVCHLRASSPCIDAGDDAVVAPADTDLDGNPRITGLHVDMGAYEWQAPNPWTVSLGTQVVGGVTVAEKVAYVAGNDGKLYARSTEDGSVLPGFPVDINAAVGATVKLPSRPAVYYGKTGKAIYLTTDRGDVVRVLPTGQVSWHVRPLTGQTVSTPAVTPDGYVYVNLSTGLGRFSNYVFKLDETTGTPLSLSPFLGYTTTDNIGDFSPAANSRYLYVNSGWGSRSGLTLLNQDNLAVRSSFAGGEQCLSPLLLGSDLLLASKGGKAWKMNAVTLAPDLRFGHFGVADLGTQISAAPFSDAAGNVYIGTSDGWILKWVPASGSFQPFYTATGKIAGLTIDRTAGVLGFGTSTGSFVQVPLDSPSSATTVAPGGPISTGTVYEALTDRFIVATDNGILSGYPAMR